MTLRVAVVGSGPAGSSAAEILAKAGIETYLFERKLDNAKPCGGAIPLCMVSEFDLPPQIIDRQVRKMKMISPSNREVDINLEKEEEYIGMCRREVLDGFLRDRAASLGANLINATVHKLDIPTNNTDPYTIHYVDHSEGGAQGIAKTLKVDAIIGADGANSRIAKEIDAGDYNYAIAFQERIRLPQEMMTYYNDLAEMYAGNDVSTDFYAWVFPKYDHVAVGTGTMQVHKASIKQLQAGIRARAAKKLVGGEIIKVEAHPIPEHPRPRRVVGRVALVGDAAVGMHPVTAHGFNFGLKSINSLMQALVWGKRNHLGIAAPPVLQRYQQQHRKDTRPLFLATHAIAKLYNDDRLPARIIRTGVLRLSHFVKPFKRQLAGFLSEPNNTQGLT